MKKISVLCVDDSALVRGLMTEIINSQPDMEVVATAPDPLVARELIKRHNPDVLTLDVEMPRMDGLDFLEKLMRLRPMPVVMVSSLTERGGEITLRALELGAIDFVTKPKLGIRDGLLEYTEIIADKIRAASRAKLRAPAAHAAPAAPAPMLRRPLASSEKLVIVASDFSSLDETTVLAPCRRSRKPSETRPSIALRTVTREMPSTVLSTRSLGMTAPRLMCEAATACFRACSSCR